MGLSMEYKLAETNCTTCGADVFVCARCLKSYVSTETCDIHTKRKHICLSSCRFSPKGCILKT
jgi:hypothetical protein